MREIKFRAFINTKNCISVLGEFTEKYGRLHEVFFIDFSDKTLFIKVAHEDRHGKYYDKINLDFESVELMQYLGVKDREGIEIYEGDVLYHSGFDVYCFVFFDEKELRFSVEIKEGANIFFNHQDYKCMKVVGNIHENPKLLELNSSCKAVKDEN